MERELKNEETKNIVLPDASHFSYTVKQVEITNNLGAVVALLDEYSILNYAGKTYKLYKTKEGTWYDRPNVNSGAANALLITSKMAINSSINTHKLM